MIYSKDTIKRKLHGTDKLITHYVDSGICNSSYKVRIGKFVIPHSGLVVKQEKLVKHSCWDKIRYSIAKLISPHNNLADGNNNNDISNVYMLKPREIVLFETLEQISMPNNLMGSYTALNSVAQKGVLLINASMVEPGYKGPLSGILVNFSSKKVELKLGMQIAKICFHQLDQNVNESQDPISENDYTTELTILAKEYYTETFLDIKTILNGVESKMKKIVKREVTFAGILVTILLFIGTMEPFVYNAFWGHTSFNEWLKNNDMEELDSLKKQQQVLLKEIKELKNEKK